MNFQVVIRNFMGLTAACKPVQHHALMLFESTEQCNGVSGLMRLITVSEALPEPVVCAASRILLQSGSGTYVATNDAGGFGPFANRQAIVDILLQVRGSNTSSDLRLLGSTLATARGKHLFFGHHLLCLEDCSAGSPAGLLLWATFYMHPMNVFHSESPLQGFKFHDLRELLIMPSALLTIDTYHFANWPRADLTPSTSVNTCAAAVNAK